MKLTDLQDRILRDKQRRTFNNVDYVLRFDWERKCNFYSDYSERDIHDALSGLVELGLTDTISNGHSVELNLTDKGVKLACLMLS